MKTTPLKRAALAAALMSTALMTRDAAGNGTAKVAERLRELRAATEPHRREATVGHIDVEARTVELSFSSEVEYERWWGIEILGHDAHEVDLSRLANKAALLWMHKWDDQRGVVESVRIDGDRKGRAVVRFSKSAAGEQLFQDIVDGIVTKVSVGYTIEGIKLVEERENVDVYRVTAWTPYEISMVSVPADDTVGVGRSAEKPQEEPQGKPAETAPSISNAPEQRTSQRTDNTMNEKTLRDDKGNLVRAKVDQDGKIVEVLEVIERAGAATAAGTDTERTRAKEILALGDQYAGSIPNARELAATAVSEGHSRAQFQEALLEAFNKRAAAPLSEQNGAAHVGMSDKEVRRYSFMNVIRALANPNDKALQAAAAFEIECSRAACETLGRTASGILVPPDVLSRAMSTTQANAGATMVETEVMKGSFIDLLRNRTISMQLATVISGLVGNVDIPKKVSDGQAYWLGEGQDAGETGFTVGQISFSPKTLGAFTDITRRLLKQSNTSVEGLVRADLILAIATAIDRAYWYGTGNEYQPLGIKNQDGLNAVAFATAGQPTYGELVDMETEISADNADIGSMAYVGNARFRGHCKKTLQFPGVDGGSRIWESGNTVNGYRTEITNQVQTGDVFFGNFADSIIGLWGGLDLTVDTATLSKSGGLRIVAFQDVDMGLRRKESICIGG